MRFGPLSQARIAVSRRVVRSIFATAWMHERLHKGRQVPQLDPELAVMLSLDDLSGDTHVWRWTPEQARYRVALSIAIVEDPIADSSLRIEPLHIPASATTPALAARVYASADCPRPAPGLVYIHGGGWVTGDLDTHDTLCARLARLGGLRVISVAYRLAPEHPYPAAVDDSLAAFRYIAQNAESLGLDPARIGVAGDSAGGNLSAVIGLRTRGDARRPALTALLYPALDATRALPSHHQLDKGFFLTREAMDWYYNHYAGSATARQRDPDISPLHATEVAGAPKTLIVAAGFDPLRDEALTYGERLRTAGVPTTVRLLPDMLHGFALMTGLSPAARTATDELCRTIGSELRG